MRGVRTCRSQCSPSTFGSLGTELRSQPLEREPLLAESLRPNLLSIFISVVNVGIVSVIKTKESGTGRGAVLWSGAWVVHMEPQV